MPNATDVKFDKKFFQECSLGVPQTVKSVAEYSFPKPMESLDSDLRKGWLNCTEWLNMQGVKILPFTPRKASYEDYIKELNQLEALFESGQRPYETILLDALGSFCRILSGDARELMSGMVKGKLRLSGPPDFKYVTQAVFDVFDYFKTVPCNVIVSAHIQPRWGKPVKLDNQGKEVEYVEEAVIGSSLAGVSHNLGESILGYFDEVYEFSKSDDGSRHYVQFYSDYLARTVLPVASRTSRHHE